MMPLLELATKNPDWLAALEIALARPAGVPERRSHEDPWNTGPVERPRRISDDLAWLRQAMDEPAANGLVPVEDEHLVGVWDARQDAEAVERLLRLEARGVLRAAGFVLHEAKPASV